MQVYKCPACGGAVTFDAALGQLGCAWCGNTYGEADLATRRTTVSVQGYVCPECGAELMTDDFIAADTCPYCGNNEVAPHRFEGAFEPDFVIPFAVTRKRAIECYEASLEERRFLPDDYVDEAQIVSVQGTYVPFWLKSGVVDFDLTFRANVRVNDSDCFSYHHRVGTYDYSRVPADGSALMADDMMDSLEPYGYDALVPFSTAYLPGFVAERFSVGDADTDSRVDRRVANSAIAAAKSTVKYPHKRPAMYANHCRTFGHRYPAEQALLPVWLIVVAYQGKKYLVGVNGQTEKVAVNLPIDKRKQSAAALRQMLKNALAISGEILVVFAFFFGCLMLAMKTASPAVAIAKLSELFGNAKMRPVMIAIAAVFGILFGGLLVSESKNGFLFGRRRAKKSMQNVEVATDADAFAVDGFHLTVSKEEVGPAVE
ncbi:MAG: zinc ribbon domain-containing protein [Atopobiaceae bacterium]|nr:zinc ribbon domain-containing protein [Atopobiaceae bacterium]